MLHLSCLTRLIGLWCHNCMTLSKLRTIMRFSHIEILEVLKVDVIWISKLKEIWTLKFTINFFGNTQVFSNFSVMWPLFIFCTLNWSVMNRQKNLWCGQLLLLLYVFKWVCKKELALLSLTHMYNVEKWLNVL